MYFHPVAHLDISLDKIFQLWQSYRPDYLSRPNKNTISIQKDDLAIFSDESWIEKTSLTPVSAFFGVTPPRSRMSPHRDPSTHPKVIQMGYHYHPWALNIPLTCDVGSWISWHRARPGKQTKLEGEEHSPYSNVRVPMADFDDLYEVSRVTLDRPMIINTFEWHSVTNETDETRLIFSLRFDKIISIREAAARFT